MIFLMECLLLPFLLLEEFQDPFLLLVEGFIIDSPKFLTYSLACFVPPRALKASSGDLANGTSSTSPLVTASPDAATPSSFPLFS
jgi:hypothetical protein